MKYKFYLLKLVLLVCTISCANRAVNIIQPTKGIIPKCGHVEGKTDLEKWDGKYTYFNELDEVVKVEVYDNGKLIQKERFAPQAYYFDSLERVIEVHRYNVDGYCISTLEEFSALMSTETSKNCIVKYKYDASGHLVELATYDENRKLIEHDPITLNIYNDQGLLVETRHLDKDRKLFENDFVGAYVRHTYNENKQLLRTDHYNAAGDLVDANFGSSTIIYNYDQHNNLVERRLLMPNGDLAPFDFAGPPIEVRTYDAKNRQVGSQAFYNEKSPIGSMKFKNDSLGRRIWEDYYDGGDTLINSSHAWQYDENNQVVKEEYFDANGRLEKTLEAGIFLEIDGWDWIKVPSIHFDSVSSGTMKYKFTLDDHGNILSYDKTYESASGMLDHCRDIMNHLKLKKVSANPSTSGTIQFVKLDL